MNLLSTHCLHLILVRLENNHTKWESWGKQRRAPIQWILKAKTLPAREKKEGTASKGLDLSKYQQVGKFTALRCFMFLKIWNICLAQAIG